MKLLNLPSLISARTSALNLAGFEKKSIASIAFCNIAIFNYTFIDVQKGLISLPKRILLILYCI